MKPGAVSMALSTVAGGARPASLWRAGLAAGLLRGQAFAGVAMGVAAGNPGTLAPPHADSSFDDEELPRYPPPPLPGGVNPFPPSANTLAPPTPTPPPPPTGVGG